MTAGCPMRSRRCLQAEAARPRASPALDLVCPVLALSGLRPLLFRTSAFDPQESAKAAKADWTNLNTKPRRSARGVSPIVRS